MFDVTSQKEALCFTFIVSAISIAFSVVMTTLTTSHITLAQFAPSIFIPGTIAPAASYFIAQKTLQTHFLNEQLKHALDHDQMTQLLVRRAFFDAAETRRTSGEDCAVFVIDIDHFKRVNDRFGHATGDSVIIAFANYLKSISQNGILSARFGGEEFVVLLPATSPANAKAFGETIVRDTAKLRVEGPAGDIFFTVSAGLCMLPHDIAMDTALNRADDALYLAKSHGRNQLALAPAIDPAPAASRSSLNLRNNPRDADAPDALNGRRMSRGT